MNVHPSGRDARRSSAPITTALTWTGAAAAVVAVSAALAAVSVARTQGPTDAERRVVSAADVFLAALDPAQRSKANPPLNAKTRTVWSNLPTGIAMQVGATERNGLKLGDMTPAQEKAALALLAAALSADGYRKVMNIVDADEALEQRSAPSRAATTQVRFGRREFYLAMLGKVSTGETWMLQFGGHHLAINVTFAARARVLTPTHTGAQPASFTVEGRTVRPLGDESDKAFALINALAPDQRQQAILGVQVRNLVLGPGEDGKMVAPEGAKASTFNAAQRAQLLDLIGEWVGIVGDEASAAKMADVKTKLDDTYFAWAGATTNGSPAYFRIQGPTVFIEYAPQGGQNSTDHIHTIYRDPTNDYAAGVTAR
jgi:hypothetical protein